MDPSSPYFLFLTLLSTLPFLYYFALSLPKGFPRLLALSPFLPLYLLFPWHVSTYHFRAVLSLVFLWTAPSKLLLLCWNTGIDSYPWMTSTFPRFLAAILLPVKVIGPKSKQTTDESVLQATVSVLSHVAGLILLLNLYSLRQLIPEPLICAMYCLHFYFAVQVVLGGSSRLVSAVFNVEVGSPFNNPFMSSSLSEFWGRRWNLTVISLLRLTVYKPVIDALMLVGEDESSAKVRLLWVSTLGTLATFTVSGLMHEIVFFYMTKSDVTWEVTTFFILHGVATVMEKATRRRGLPLPPRALCAVFTLSVLYATACKFFLPPLRTSQTDLKIIAEYHQFQNWLLGSLMKENSFIQTFVTFVK